MCRTFNLKTLLILTAISVGWFCRFAERMRREQAAGRVFAPKAAKVVARPRTICGITLGDRITGLEFRERSSKPSGWGRYKIGSTSKAASQRGPIELDDGTILGGLCDLDWRDLVEMTSLTDLAIDSNTLTDACLREVAALTQLKSLRLICPQMTNVGVGHLSRLRELESLELTSDKITDTGLARLLSSLPQLARLQIHGPVGRNSVSAICSMRNLMDLHIRSVGPELLVDSDAVLLRNSPALRSIGVSGDIVDSAAVTRTLKRAKPGATVVVSGRVKLLLTASLRAQIYNRRLK